MDSLKRSKLQARRSFLAYRPPFLQSYKHGIKSHMRHGNNCKKYVWPKSYSLAQVPYHQCIRVVTKVGTGERRNQEKKGKDKEKYQQEIENRPEHRVPRSVGWHHS